MPLKLFIFPRSKSIKPTTIRLANENTVFTMFTIAHKWKQLANGMAYYSWWVPEQWQTLAAAGSTIDAVTQWMEASWHRWDKPFEMDNNQNVCVCVLNSKNRSGRAVVVVFATKHGKRENRSRDWRLCWKIRNKLVPLDEDGLLNGKTCQKHTMTKHFSFFIIDSPLLPFHHIFVDHGTIHTCDKDDIPFFNRRGKHRTQPTLPCVMLRAESVSANNSCFTIKFYFRLLSPHFSNKWFFTRTFSPPSNVLTTHCIVCVVRRALSRAPDPQQP